MTILELREKRNTAWNAAKAFLDSHRTEKGTLTAEDDATYSRMEQEIADLGKEIARLERQEALDAELSKPVNKPLTSKPVIIVCTDFLIRHQKRIKFLFLCFCQVSGTIIFCYLI